VGGFVPDFEAVRTAFDGRCSAQVRDALKQQANSKVRKKKKTEDVQEEVRGLSLKLCGNQPVRRVHPTILH